MSTLAVIKDAAAALPLKERFVLQVQLADLNEHDGDYQRVIAQRMKRMDAGEKMTLKELEARHEALVREGF